VVGFAVCSMLSQMMVLTTALQDGASNAPQYTLTLPHSKKDKAVL
jgi:hypothetical protein